MAITIYLDNQFQVWAEKIHDELIDWFLTVEIEVVELFVFQSVPEQDFSEGAVLAEFSGQFSQPWIVIVNGHGRIG